MIILYNKQHVILQARWSLKIPTAWWPLNIFQRPKHPNCAVYVFIIHLIPSRNCKTLLRLYFGNFFREVPTLRKFPRSARAFSRSVPLNIFANKKIYAAGDVRGLFVFIVRRWLLGQVRFGKQCDLWPKPTPDSAPSNPYTPIAKHHK